MRHLQHPGPVAAARATVVPARLQPCTLSLPAGATLLQALAKALAAHGARSAVLQLGPATLFPFAWVMPALSRTAEHAVYFSERFAADAPVQLGTATVTVGERDGATSLHVHASWQDAQGRRHIGHLLPHEVVLRSPLIAQAWLLDGAGFVAQPDDETRFTLFQPVPQPPRSDAGAAALAVRVAPNEDLCHALEALCRQHGITHATVRGGVGSTVGAVFEDGRVVEPFVTELLVRQGRVAPGPDGAPVATLDISLVDHTGGLADGRLARGANPVLVTAELVLQPD